MREAGGDVKHAAVLAGCSLTTYYQRARRAGLNVSAMRWMTKENVVAARVAPATGDARLEPDGTVTMTLADYAVLQARAAQAAPTMWEELMQANRIIATLTRTVEDMGRRAGGVAAVVLCVLCLSGPVGAQVPVAEVAGRAYAPNELATVQEVDARCPGLVLRDHDFTDAVFSLLHSRDERWGRNGKRGNPNDLSHDAGAYKTSASPFGVAVIDIIVAAGASNARPGWQDVTDATIAAGTVGVWVRPSGVLPACLTVGAPGPTPDPAPVPPVVTPPTSTDLTEVLVALSRIEERLAALEDTQHPEQTLRTLDAYVDDMIGKGPTDGHPDTPNHVTDLKLRLDVIREQLEQMNAWLRSRTILRR